MEPLVKAVTLKKSQFDQARAFQALKPHLTIIFRELQRQAELLQEWKLRLDELFSLARVLPGLDVGMEEKESTPQSTSVDERVQGVANDAWKQMPESMPTPERNGKGMSIDTARHFEPRVETILEQLDRSLRARVSLLQKGERDRDDNLPESSFSMDCGRDSGIDSSTLLELSSILLHRTKVDFNQPVLGDLPPPPPPPPPREKLSDRAAASPVSPVAR